MHEQSLRGIADARSLGLRIDDDALGHGEVGRGVDVDMAVPVPVEHVGDGGVLEDHREQPRASSGDQAVDDTTQPDELHRRLVRGVLDEHDGVDRQPGLLDSLSQRRGDDAVGLESSRRPPEQRRVARLQAQGGGVGCDVRAVLVDDPHDAERDADPLDAQTVRPDVAFDDLTYGIGQHRHRPEAAGHGRDTRLGKPEPVDHRRRCAGAQRAGNIALVRAQDLVGPIDQAISSQHEGLVLRGGGEHGEQPGSGLGALSQIGQ